MSGKQKVRTLLRYEDGHLTFWGWALVGLVVSPPALFLLMEAASLSLESGGALGAFLFVMLTLGLCGILEYRAQRSPRCDHS